MEQHIIEYLKLFNVQHEYFKAHEVLEEAWIIKTKTATKDHPYIILIQLAAIMLHWQRSNYKGALSVLSKVESSYGSLLSRLDDLGFKPNDFISLITNLALDLNNKRSFYPYQIINDY
ncbi:MAG: DUF309 domain-containing protein [Bacilli bacterium]